MNESVASSDDILKLVYEAIDDVNEQLDEEQRIEKSDSAVLAGPSGRLSSLNIVGLLAGIENRIETNFGRSLNLLNEIDDLSRQDGALGSPSNLATHIYQSLNGKD